MKTRLTINLNNLDRVKRFNNVTATFKSDINIIKGSQIFDAKSTMGIFSISLIDPVDVEIISDDDEEIMRFNYEMEEFV